VVDASGDAGELRPVVYGLDVALLALGLANLLATLLLGIRERRRDLGVLKTIGLTPRQVAAALVTANALFAGAAALIGIPLGLGLFRAVLEADGSAGSLAYPSWWALALLVPASVAAVAFVAAPVARRAAAHPVAAALRVE
jgi:putative ABC transport system permease protein